MHKKEHLVRLAPFLAGRGIRHVVICPGSRNAPLIQLFTRDDSFICHNLVDERSAAYVALGMARELGETVAILTTSGTAVLNLAPAVAEAYYQGVPLLVLTADRPLEALESFNNQWVDQQAPYYSYSKGFMQVPAYLPHEDAMEPMLARMEDLLLEAKLHRPGPVHMNFLLEDPLYEKLPEAGKAPEISEPFSPEPESGKTAPGEIGELLSGDAKIMVLAGMGAADHALEEALETLCHYRDVVVVAENIANLHAAPFVAHPELSLAHCGEDDWQELAPDLLLTFRGQVVSKRLKMRLQSMSGLEHRRVDRQTILGLAEAMTPSGSAPGPAPVSPGPYALSWKRCEEQALRMAGRKLAALPFGVFSGIAAAIGMAEKDSVVHLGNSSTIRYSQLLPCRTDLEYYSNRGTSGIDGCLSSAVGAAMVSSRPHLLLVGDLSFVYDSNGLWNKDFPDNLKVVVLNDGEGGIFRLLKGPRDMEFFEEHSLTRHPVSLELLAQAFGRKVLRAADAGRLAKGLRSLLDPAARAAILEVDATASENSRIFEAYFKP